MNTKDIRYTLERYRSGGGNRYVCPQCGRKKCFTRYVDVETGDKNNNLGEHKMTCLIQRNAVVARRKSHV